MNYEPYTYYFDVSPELDADMVFGYQYDGGYISHQPKMIYSVSDEEDVTLMGWNTNGQMTSMVQPNQDRFRKHLWDEAGQLAVAIGNEYCGYYGYNANGERVYKLTGTVLADQYDAGDVNIETYFDDIVLYVNPYMVVTPRGYTKHYYNGSERIAARLGDYWMDGGTIVDESGMMYQAREVLEDRMSDLNGNEEYFENEAYRSIYGEDFCCESHILRINNINYNYAEDMLLDVFNGGIRQSDYMGGIAQGIFYYHTDHLGSASWITDDQGEAVQYIHYMPYGELWVNQQANQYDERFKFTGKERDAETGYDYFGARYYSSMLGHWLSVDKLADDYPHITPYAQSVWNPIKYKDPDGNFVGTAIDIICVGMDLYSLGKNLAEGNTQAALIDAGALAIDALAALVPGVTAGAGIAVKAARAADKGKDVAHATTSVVANSHNYRKALQQATGKAGKGYEAHHTLPQKYRTKFEEAGINIDEPGNVVWRKTEEHRKNNHNITKEWEDFFEKNKKSTAEQIYKNRDKIETKYFNNTTGDL